MALYKPADFTYQAVQISGSIIVRRIGSSFGHEDEVTAVRGKRCASVNGFSIHPNRCIGAKDRSALEKLLAYGARGPFSNQRLSLLDPGQVNGELVYTVSNQGARLHGHLLDRVGIPDYFRLHLELVLTISDLDRIISDMENRQLYQDTIIRFLPLEQMLFISGPRQVGKTTLAKMLSAQFATSSYVNWDIATDRKTIRTDPYFYEQLDRPTGAAPLVIFDEIHKSTGWKNYLKGVYDRDKGLYHFIVTGSGRLDVYRKGGDSLAGRYFLVHVWPFTLAELGEHRVSLPQFRCDPLAALTEDASRLDALWSKLGELSGFPTPFLAGSKEVYRVWSETYRNQLVREDVRSLETIVKIDQLEALTDLLPSRVASPLSINNLAADIGVSFDTAKSWLQILERFYLIFRISPYSVKISRSLTKEQKVYLFDYGQIEDPAARFENMVAVELYRAVTSWNEQGFGKFGLEYLRTKDKDECDFVVTEKSKPIFMVECKLSDTTIAKSLLKFQDQLQVPALQLVAQPGVLRRINRGDLSTLVVSAPQWLSTLP